MIFLKFAGIQRRFLYIVIDIDECNASARVCDVNAYCQNTLGSHVCSCKHGFTGDGKTCTGEDMLNVLGEREYVLHGTRNRNYTHMLAYYCFL